jgi:hypothetical protein
MRRGGAQASHQQPRHRFNKRFREQRAGWCSKDAGRETLGPALIFPVYAPCVQKFVHKRAMSLRAPEHDDVAASMFYITEATVDVLYA